METQAYKLYEKSTGIGKVYLYKRNGSYSANNKNLQKLKKVKDLLELREIIFVLIHRQKQLSALTPSRSYLKRLRVQSHSMSSPQTCFVGRLDFSGVYGEVK